MFQDLRRRCQDRFLELIIVLELTLEVILRHCLPRGGSKNLTTSLFFRDFGEWKEMGSLHNLSFHPVWVDRLQKYIKPYWDDMLNGNFVESVTHARLSVSEMQGWMLQLYPFIHAFPKFLAEALIKVEDDVSRSFLIDNIRVEKAHAEHWIWMGTGFGLKREEMIELAEGNRPVLRDVQSLTDWLWYVNTKGSLAEAVAATSYAIEGITGAMATKACQGFESYRGRPGVDMNPKTYKWMREHAHYDDKHPEFALEIVKRYATTERLQTKVMLAAKRSMQLLKLAFDTSYRAYAPLAAHPVVTAHDNRANERRGAVHNTGFPDRRFRDRRGCRHHSAA